MAEQNQHEKYWANQVNIFKGVNLNVAPTLLEDAEARQLLNLRIEKIGKLVTRNGYFFGVFLNCEDAKDFRNNQWNPYIPAPSSPFDPTYVPLKHLYTPGINALNIGTIVCGYPYCAGILGFGEFRLENYWEEIDTDRLLVVAIRHPYLSFQGNPSAKTKDLAGPNLDQFFSDLLQDLNEPSKESLSDKDVQNIRRLGHLMELLFVPLSGKYKNMVLDPYYLFSGDKRRSYWYNKLQILSQDLVYPGVTRERSPMSIGEQNVLLFAPNRYIEYYTDPLVMRLNSLKNSGPAWLKSLDLVSVWSERFDRLFVKMSQYRNYLIISDPKNGDMNITDDWDWQDEFCGSKYHRLRIAPNCLESFDIDCVYLDLRLQPGQENDKEKGVEHGLALYRFKLPKKVTKVSVDKFDPTLTDAKFLLSDPLDLAGLSESMKEDLKKVRAQNAWSYMINQLSTTLLTCITQSRVGDSRYAVRSTQLNNSLYRIFSSVSDPVEFDDLGGELELYEEEELVTYDSDELAEKKKLKVADVFVWDKFKVRYFPTIGSTDKNIIYPYLMREIDRFFDKSNSKLPRIMYPKRKENAGKYAPLGSWQYKFVWDFGNGVFSAPSTTLNVPDIMWSATTDEENRDELTGAYYRFYNQFGFPELKYWFDGTIVAPRDRHLTLPYFNPLRHLTNYEVKHSDVLSHINPWAEYGFVNVYLRRLGLFKNVSYIDNGTDLKWQIELTRVGQLLFSLKHKIYKDLGNRYGDTYTFYTNKTVNDSVKPDKLLSEAADIDPISIVDWFTMVTCFFSATDLGTKGFAWQFVKLDLYNWREANLASMAISNELKAEIGPLVVPIFYHPDVPQSHLSLCDEEGRLRTLWLAPNYWYSLTQQKSVIMPNKFYSLPFVFSESREDIPTAYREPFYKYMQMHLLFYSELDYNNLEKKYFGAYRLYLGTLFAGTSAQFYRLAQYTSSNNPKLAKALYFDLRPSSPVRVLLKENMPYRLNITNSDVPNEVASRLILEGMVELKLVDKSERLLPWSFRSWGHESGFVWSTYYNNYHLNSSTATWSYFELNNESKWFYIVDAVLDASANNHDIYLIRLNKGFIVGTPYVNQPVLANVVPYNVNQWHDQFAVFNFTLHNVRLWQETNLYHLLPVDIDLWHQSFLPTYGLTNVEVYIYGQGERLIALEQLSVWFPSSLLFKAPRIALRIKENSVPRKARKLLIFRTKSVNNNSYNPDEFGFVKSIDIFRDEDGHIETREKREDGIEIVHKNEIYFFDNIPDDNLDFGHTPDQYEGLRRPLRSRFHVALNERVYYYNFVEEYQPEKPRIVQTQILTPPHPNSDIENKVYKSNQLPNMPSSILFRYDSTDQSGYPNGEWHIKYIIVFADSNKILSQPVEAEIQWKQTNGPKQVVVFSLLPTPYSPNVKLQIYRKIVKGVVGLTARTDNTYYLIGTVPVNNEGIFVDNFKPEKDEITCTDPVYMDYPTGLRWSRPYRPDWIDEDAFTEYKGGNIGTGLEVNYGNLVLFTDSCMARYTVQAENPPISRVDELTPEFGCIAPNSIVNNNNILFFLTWKGWMSYNNNIFKNVDEKFNNEIINLLHVLPKQLVVEISGGINPKFNELYLNFPLLPSHNHKFYIPKVFDDKVNPIQNNQERSDIVQLQSGLYFDFGDIEKQNHYQNIWGHIYVLNYQAPYSTKFAYLLTLRVKHPLFDLPRYHKKVTNPLEPVRLYYVDSNGDLRSGDIIPNNYPNPFDNSLGNLQYKWAGLYIENPTSTSVMNQPLYRSYTKTNNNYNYILEEVLFTDEDVYPLIPKMRSLFTAWIVHYDFSDYRIGQRYIFPIPLYSPIKWLYFTKWFTDWNETNLKRIRKCLVNIYSKGDFIVNIQTLRIGDNDTNIEDYDLNNAWKNLFFFDPTETYYNADENKEYIGRYNSIISCLPTIPYQTTGLLDSSLVYRLDDTKAKPTKSSVEIYGRKYAQINEVEIIWRHIHKYLL